VQMAYVEFYIDGEMLAASEEWPYTERWNITEPGEYELWAVAFDAAGNSAESGHVVIEVEP